MKHTCIRKWVTAVSAIFLLAACSQGGQQMIGPRTEEAWKEWDRQQELLKETWGDTEVYAYIRTIMDDLQNVNANVVFREDFSLENDSEELTALKKLYNDTRYSDEMTLKEFLAFLDSSSLRWSVGGLMDLDRIEDKGNGEYAVTLLDYPTPDALMAVPITVKQNEDGSFRTILK